MCHQIISWMKHYVFMKSVPNARWLFRHSLLSSWFVMPHKSMSFKMLLSLWQFLYNSSCNIFFVSATSITLKRINKFTVYKIEARRLSVVSRPLYTAISAKTSIIPDTQYLISSKNKTIFSSSNHNLTSLFHSMVSFKNSF